MLKNILFKVIEKFGYSIRKISNSNGQELILHKYLKGDGSFDYQNYRKVQQEGNKSKIENIWVIEDNIKFLSDYMREIIHEPKFGICHGTRRGKEQEWFRKYLECEVIGTEISETATQFANTIQWDFHETKPEWVNSVDFIYSNSFDHSYDPEKCLTAWMSCIKKNGLCIIEHSNAHGPTGSSELDPFGAEITIMPYLITKWGSGQYCVREFLKAPCKNEFSDYLHFIVIKKL